MRRRLFTHLSALSVALCAATCLLWARSYTTTQYLGWSSPRQFCGILSMAGLLRLEHATYDGGDPGWSYVVYPTPQGNPPGLWSEVRTRDRHGGVLQKAGFACAVIDYNNDGKQMRRSMYLPHWAVAVLSIILPVRWVWISRRRRAPGTCPKCGYDLRATPNRCPECGTLSVKK